MAKYIIIAGVLIVIAGVLLYFIPGMFKWFGRLPGDINYSKGNTRVVFPITTMIIVSVVLTIVINLVRKFF